MGFKMILKTGSKKLLGRGVKVRDSQIELSRRIQMRRREQGEGGK